ncbi:MAG TPA: hypothetical protein VIS06_14095 [Mycobacteriales bacterium]
MDFALLAALPVYTLLVLFFARRRWARHCAECSYRHRVPAGRHRPDRVAASDRPISVAALVPTLMSPPAPEPTPVLTPAAAVYPVDTQPVPDSPPTLDPPPTPQPSPVLIPIPALRYAIAAPTRPPAELTRATVGAGSVS